MKGEIRAIHYISATDVTKSFVKKYHPEEPSVDEATKVLSYHGPRLRKILKGKKAKLYVGRFHGYGIVLNDPRSFFRN